MIDIYDHDNGDGFSTADRTVDIFDALNNRTYQGIVDYHPRKLTKEGLASEIYKRPIEPCFFEVPKEVYYPAKELPPYNPSDNSNYLNPNDSEVIASAMQKLGDRIYNIKVQPVRQPFHIYGVWMISLFTGYGMNPDRQIPVYINPYCEWRIQAASREEAEEIACGALLTWFLDRFPLEHVTIKKIARDLYDLANEDRTEEEKEK